MGHIGNLRATDSSGTSRAVRLALRGSASALVLGAACLTGSLEAAAGPDACNVAGATATCSGNQSDGIAFAGGAVTRVDVIDLDQPITPPAGVRGVDLQAVGADSAIPGVAGSTAPPLTVTIDPAATITTDGAPAVFVSGRGGGAVPGANAADPVSDGQAGGAGGAGSAITITNDGTLNTSNGRLVRIRDVELGVNELQDTNDALTKLDREAVLRRQELELIDEYNDTHTIAIDPHTIEARDELGLMTPEERAFYDANKALVDLVPTLLYPFIETEQAELDRNTADLTKLKIFLESPPLPEEVPDLLSGAVVARSTGGNGSQGGEGGTVADPDGDPPVVPRGGRGGNGGAGGDITITNNGDDTINATVADPATQGYHAGILAISRGGDAGLGGGNSVGPGTGANTLAGQGGVGGAGGTITVVNNGTIITNGQISPAIFAQSAGGRGSTGANGGQVVDSIFGPIISDRPGNGSAGGAGGVISITHNGTIATGAYGSYGIFAQSVGGEGGPGSDTGGLGGVGGAGGAVTVNVNGDIDTGGTFSHGVFASSLGGKGGDGGDSGGSGGDGGVSGAATINVAASASVTTAGDNAHAVYAQSKGGTGGVGDSVGGFWVTAGGGGNGGVGGDAAITNLGMLTTTGAYAYGLFSQALGGAGGYAGSASGFVAFSGEGGGGAPAGDATATNSGAITTEGEGSHALFAQSVAGGGGDAGAAGGFVALGGTGGDEAAALCTDADRTFCNDGGTVTVNNSGAIVTEGDAAYGIFAESVGGGGGNGGNSSGLFAFGGNGGVGGNGGAVTVNNTGSVMTSGFFAYSLFAQSVGGGGGNGGSSTSLSVGLPAVSIGGSGGGGGDGGMVDVINAGTLAVQGLGSIALFAQSVGGGGGSGGDATAIGLSPLTLAIGGSGGEGGDGGEVIVGNSGSIVTNGDFSDAIIAQSVGGGGGKGGSAYTAGANAFFQASVAVGGTGGGGGDGGGVTVTNTGTIETFDYDSRGIFAQSVGGGGGKGGSSSATSVAAAPNYSLAVAVAVGGSGGEGGVGGVVDVTNDSSIITWGSGSHGVQAQSVGGGGGSGGDAFASSISLAGEATAAVSVSVGGSGGDGGDGGVVNVTNRGRIQTAGDTARGVFAQSVGGGGGDGGSSTSVTYADTLNMLKKIGQPSKPSANASLTNQLKAKASDVAAKAKELRATSFSKARQKFADLVKGRWQDFKNVKSGAVSVGVGGSGGVAGDGGAVNVDNIGAIDTFGSMAYAIAAQSVGGGGGMGGAGTGESDGSIGVGVGVGGAGGAAGDGGTVTVTNTGQLSTFGPFTYGILAQSVGGGGVGAQGAGDGGGFKSISASIGGNGGAFGHGGAVTVEQNGNVVTIGTGSIGVLAQSIGGGGGIGIVNSVPYEPNDDETPPGTGGDADPANFINFTMGGQGGAGGNGGAVNVAVNGNVATEGDGAHGVFAQSVGGGGGLGGNTTADTYTFSIGLGPFGDIKVWESNEAFSAGLNLGGNGGSGGNGGDVAVMTSGTITTTGNYAHGIVAQSVAGGGGIGGSTQNAVRGFSGSAGGGGTAGKIDITHTGNIFASGVNSHGIFAQSMSGAGNAICLPLSGCASDGGDMTGRGSDITVTVNGTISGGAGEGVGIALSGGAANTITNDGGTITSLSGNAIIGTDGDDTVLNAGLVIGNVGLGGGANAFVNQVGGTFQPGPSIYLGPGGTLTNSGLFQPGGPGVGMVTTLGSTFFQTATGIYEVDLDFTGGVSDRLNVDGDAIVGGAIVPRLLTLMPGAPKTIISAEDGLTDAGATIADTVVIDYGLTFGATDLGVTVDADFVNARTPNQRATARHFQNVWDGGGALPLAGIMGFLGNFTTVDAYSAALDRLHPEPHLAGVNTTMLASIDFVDGMMSCRGVNGAVGPLRESACTWLKVAGTFGTRERTSANIGYDTEAQRVQVGQQWALAPGWFAGLSAGYGRTRTTIDNRGSATGDHFNGGVVLKHEMGPWLFAGAVNVGYGAMDMTRRIGIPAPGLAALSRPHIWHTDLRLRAAYLADFGAWYARPALDVDLFFVHMPSFTETGAGALNVTTRSMRDFVAAFTPSIEIGHAIERGDGHVIRPYLSAGVSIFTEKSWSLASTFAGTPAAIGPYTVTTPIEQVLGKVSAGVDMSDGRGFNLRLNYDGKLGAHTVEHTASAKLNLRF